MPSCKCFGSTTCNCLIESGSGVDVNGSGTTDNPYVISQAATASSQFAVDGPVDGVYTITHTSGAGVITQELIDVASASATNITTNLVDNGDNTLNYTNEPGAVQTFEVLEDHRNVVQFIDNGTIALTGAAVEDRTHHEVQTTLSNNDPHGRTQLVTVHYFWLGFADAISATGSAVIQPSYIASGTTWTQPGQWQDYGAVANRQYSHGGWALSETFTLAPSATRAIGSRYRIGAVSGVTLFAGSFFSNGFTIDRQALN